MSENPKCHTGLLLLQLTVDYKSPYLICMDFLEELTENVAKE